MMKELKLQIDCPLNKVQYSPWGDMMPLRGVSASNGTHNSVKIHKAKAESQKRQVAKQTSDDSNRMVFSCWVALNLNGRQLTRSHCSGGNEVVRTVKKSCEKTLQEKLPKNLHLWSLYVISGSTTSCLSIFIFIFVYFSVHFCVTTQKKLQRHNVAVSGNAACLFDSYSNSAYCLNPPPPCWY